jgi:NTP pyrophosphatase (non-canonical NTP hydrolase)
VGYLTSESLTVEEMQRMAWGNSEAKGFHLFSYPHPTGPHWDNYIASKLALIHSEVSEALEALREGNHAAVLGSNSLIETEEDEHPGKPYGFMSELADIVIRVGDLAGIVGGDLEAALELKMEYNETRPFKHGKAL